MTPKMRYYPWHAILAGRKMDVGIKKKWIRKPICGRRKNFKTYSKLDWPD